MPICDILILFPLVCLETIYLFISTFWKFLSYVSGLQPQRVQELQRPITFFVVEIGLWNHAASAIMWWFRFVWWGPKAFYLFSKQSYGHFKFAHGCASEKCCQIVTYGQKLSIFFLSKVMAILSLHVVEHRKNAVKSSPMIKKLDCFFWEY